VAGIDLQQIWRGAIDEICRRKHGGAAATTYLVVGGAVELDDPAGWVSRGGVAGACATVAVERGAPLG
jgi:hypothetical protein